MCRLRHSIRDQIGSRRLIDQQCVDATLLCGSLFAVRRNFDKLVAVGLARIKTLYQFGIDAFRAGVVTLDRDRDILHFISPTKKREEE
jgi:hypothetical protein